MKNEQQHYKSLDGLRGLAALSVVFWHYATTFVPFLIGYTVTARHSSIDHLISTSPLQLPFAGNFAVCIFFVLSGFVLSVSFFKHGREVSILVSSAVRRYFRLMLPAFGSILLAYIAMRVGLFYIHQVAGISQTTSGVGMLWSFPAHLGQALFQGLYTIWFGTYDAAQSYNNVLWTMHLELFGSFLVFMFLALFGKLKNRWVFYAVFAIAFMKTYYLAFIAGLCISDIVLTQPYFKNSLRVWALWPLAALGIFLGTWSINIYPHLHTGLDVPFFTAPQIEQFAHIIGAIMIVIVALKLQSVTKFLERKPVQYLGKISFSLYLIHYILIGTVASYLFMKIYPAYGYKLALPVATLVTFPLTIVGAHFYTKWLDTPSILLSKRIGNYLLSGDLLGDLMRRQQMLGQLLRPAKRQISTENLPPDVEPLEKPALS